MAELPSLGEHCTVTHCQQLDFLPFTCDGCTKTFCSDHRTKDSHHCSQEHVKKSDAEYDGPKAFSCSLADCKKRELTEIVCEHCSKSFCLSHRHWQDHSCEKPPNIESSWSTAKTADHVNKIIASKEPRVKKPRGSKASKTAAKVALMKMKMHAVGDKGTPEEEKVYLQLLLPKTAPCKTKPMFFSKALSTGRVIDTIADRIGLKNENNILHSKKLRLFTLADGDLLPTDQTLGDLVSAELVFSGSSLVLEYVDNECVKLDDIDSYTTQAS